MKTPFLSILSLVLLLTACSGYNSIQKTADIEYKYEAAKAFYAEGAYSKAAPLLEEVITLFKGSDKAEESLLLLGLCYYESGDYVTASQYFKTFYSTYQRSEHAELARFLGGKSLYKDIPEPELDQSSTINAIQELQVFLDYYPYSKYRAETQEMLFEMHDILVYKDYMSAKLYFDLGNYMNYMGNNYQACVSMAENALKDYPYTKLREDLLILILRSKYKMATQSVKEKEVDRYRDTIDEYYAFKNEFPTSKYISEADKYYNAALKVVNE